MHNLIDFIYIQKIIHITNGSYVIDENDLSHYLYINVNKLFSKYEELFSMDTYVIINNKKFFNLDGIILISIIIKNEEIINKTDNIILYCDTINKINRYNPLLKIRI